MTVIATYRIWTSRTDQSVKVKMTIYGSQNTRACCKGAVKAPRTHVRNRFRQNGNNNNRKTVFRSLLRIVINNLYSDRRINFVQWVMIRTIAREPHSSAAVRRRLLKEFNEFSSYSLLIQ